MTSEMFSYPQAKLCGVRTISHRIELTFPFFFMFFFFFLFSVASLFPRNEYPVVWRVLRRILRTSVKLQPSAARLLITVAQVALCPLKFDACAAVALNNGYASLHKPHDALYKGAKDCLYLKSKRRNETRQCEL